MRYLATVTAIILLQAMPANAQLDPLIEGAKLCTRHLQRYEREYGIPAHLLSAIASTESGRFHDGLKIKLPWPWTINAENKGYFFDSKEEAMEMVHKLQARGVKSIDVGCMQVNLFHHPNAFTSLSQAFEPENNVAYAASFLRNLYQEKGSWKQAASDYHSRTERLGNEYFGLVYNSWYKIVDKLRNAKLNIPNNTPSTSSATQEIQQASNVSPPQPSVKYTPKYSSGIKSIKVTSQGVVSSQNNETRRRENGIIVVHPEINIASANSNFSASLPEQNRPPEPMVMADANSTGNSKQSIFDLTPSAGTTSAPPTSEAKIIRLNNKSVDKNPANVETKKPSGPNFIFDN